MGFCFCVLSLDRNWACVGVVAPDQDGFLRVVIGARASFQLCRSGLLTNGMNQVRPNLELTTRSFTFSLRHSGAIYHFVLPYGCQIKAKSRAEFRKLSKLVLINVPWANRIQRDFHFVRVLVIDCQYGYVNYLCWSGITIQFADESSEQLRSSANLEKSLW